VFHRTPFFHRAGRDVTAKAHREFQMRMLAHEQRTKWLKSEDEITEVLRIDAIAFPLIIGLLAQALFEQTVRPVGFWPRQPKPGYQSKDEFMVLEASDDERR
jgi:hypothetical protein